MARTVQGINHTWQVSDSPIGSGDAGEVYAVARLEQPDLTGVMKKPARIATGGTIQRQAGQIAQEARALSLLDGLPDGKAHPPRLLDQAPDFTKGTGNYFIISETAPGEDLSALLAVTRQTGKSFPRRVIMTVLDALFDMFARAHKAGVLWNDVKLEHIYWDNQTGKVGVIDWGNALFLDHEGRHTRPRWEDYQQMVDTLGSFLQTSAPDLFTDLGWDEFQGKTLDSTLVSTLARRISYQQQVIALQVMEYQSLIRVVLSSDPTLEGLRKIAGYQQKLEKIGAPWAREDVLNYSQTLVETTLAEGDRSASVRTIALIWEIFDDSLDLPWYLLREYCRHTDILTHDAFPDLAKYTLKANWEEALWAASTIAKQTQDPSWWEGLIPVMRQQALQTNTPAPYQACQATLDWAKQHQAENLASKLTAILRDWRHKGEGDAHSPFDYELLELVRGETELPSRLRSEIKHSFAPGEETIRELIKVWRNANWEALPKAFRRVISWDPDRWGVLGLSQEVAAFQDWLQLLYDGPNIGSSVRTYLERMLTTRPQVERSLGSPPWIGALLNMLTHIIQGAPIAAYQDLVYHYCPWLLQYPDIHAADARPVEVDQSTLQILLDEFLTQLKTSNDTDRSLNAIRAKAPLTYPLCKGLAQGFKTVLSLNIDLEQVNNVDSKSIPPELAEGYQVLNSLITWRQHLADQDLSKAMHCLSDARTHSWPLASHVRQSTQQWYRWLVPTLEAIQSFTAPPELEEQPPDVRIKQLRDISQSCFELQTLWSQIYDSGIYSQLLETLEEGIDSARTAFIEWRATLESSSDQVLRLLYLSQLDPVRQVSRCLLHLSQHIRQAKLSFTLLDESDHTSKTMQIRLVEDILYHLTALEAEFVSDTAERRFPVHQSTFKLIAEAHTAQAQQALITALPEDHPFYTWLVKSTLA